MCHMTSGICQCAQRTCSLCMYNMLHEHDACKIHTHMSSFVRDMFQDAKAKLYKTELAIFKLYGHVWTTWFSGFCHWNSLPSWTELQQELSNRLIVCWGSIYLKATSREYFLTCLHSGEVTFETGCSVICFGRGFPIWQSGVHLESFLIFQHTLWTLPWNLMVSSGIWPWGSRRACLWEMELHPNQHGVWIVFWATWATGVKMQDAGRMKATIFWYVLC